MSPAVPEAKTVPLFKTPNTAFDFAKLRVEVAVVMGAKDVARNSVEDYMLA